MTFFSFLKDFLRISSKFYYLKLTFSTLLEHAHLSSRTWRYDRGVSSGHKDFFSPTHGTWVRHSGHNARPLTHCASWKLNPLHHPDNTGSLTWCTTAGTPRTQESFFSRWLLHVLFTPLVSSSQHPVLSLGSMLCPLI